MAQEAFGRNDRRFTDIVAADEQRASAMQRVLNGLGGLLLLLGVGIVVVVMVVWRTPV